MEDIKIKLNKIVDFFKENKEELLKKDWTDGMSKEYEFSGLTYIESRDGFSILSDHEGTIAALEKDGSTSLDHEFQDELDKLSEVYDEFVEAHDEFIKRKKNNEPLFFNVLTKDDITALQMLVQDKEMFMAEKRHYIIGVDWDAKFANLENTNNDFFDKDDIKVMKLLVSGKNLNNAEKRHYIIGSNLEDKLKTIEESQKDKSINDFLGNKKSKHDINDVEVGDVLLVKFKVKDCTDLYWCDVKKIDTAFTTDNKPLLTLRINEELNPTVSDTIIDYGMDNENRSYFIDYCKHHFHDLEIGENAFDKRVLDVSKVEKALDEKIIQEKEPEKVSKDLTKLIHSSNKSQHFIELERDLSKKVHEIKSANKICSFDMEFSDRTGDNVVEVGIAMYDRATKETFSAHFIIKEQVGKYKRNNTHMEHSLMFAHGISETVPLEHAMKVLNNVMQNSDVNIIFAQENKNKHMIKHDFEDNSFINIQDLMRMNSRDGMRMALSSAVETFCDTEQPIKNAGNDAASTLEILSSVIGNRINLENYKSPVVTDFSTHPKKSSASEIRASRASNPNPIPNDKYTKEEVAETKNVTLDSVKKQKRK
jgi:hypothetical protein